MHRRLAVQNRVCRNSAALGCISIRDEQEAEYRELADNYVAMCGHNLIFNVNKTKEKIVNFWRNKPNTLSNPREKGEVMENYGNICVHLDNVHLDMQHKGCLQKGKEQTMLLVRAEILQCMQLDEVCGRMESALHPSVVITVSKTEY